MVWTGLQCFPGMADRSPIRLLHTIAGSDASLHSLCLFQHLVTCKIQLYCDVVTGCVRQVEGKTVCWVLFTFDGCKKLCGHT